MQNLCANFQISSRATCNVKGYTCDGTWTGSIKALYAHYVTNHGMSLIFRKKNALFKAKIDPNSKNFVRLFEPAVLLKVVQGQNYILRATYIRKLDAVFVYLSALYREIEEGVSAEPATGELRLVTRPKVDLMAGGDTDRVRRLHNNARSEWPLILHPINFLSADLFQTCSILDRSCLQP